MKKFFNSKFVTPPDSDEIEVTVFGNGNGESIVIHIPGVGWGVVDSCRYKIENEYVVPPHQYLKEMFGDAIPELQFVVLSHPHEDHYDGLDEILMDSKLKIKRVCSYNGVGVREHKTYLAKTVRAAKVRPKLVSVFGAFDFRRKNGSIHKILNDTSVIIDTVTTPIPGIGTVNVKLSALSPSAASMQKYRDMLFESIPKEGEIVRPLPDRLHNMISAAMLLKINDIQIVLCSDVENDTSEDGLGWAGILSNCDLPEIYANIVKVSHHGAMSGYCKEAWEKHSKFDKPIALIAPFSSHNLPNADCLSNVSDFTCALGISSATGNHDKITKYYSKEVSLAVSNIFKNPTLSKPPNKIGAIRVRMKVNGGGSKLDHHESGLWANQRT